MKGLLSVKEDSKLNLKINKPWEKSHNNNKKKIIYTSRGKIIVLPKKNKNQNAIKQHMSNSNLRLFFCFLEISLVEISDMKLFTEMQK